MIGGMGSGAMRPMGDVAVQQVGLNEHGMLADPILREEVWQRHVGVEVRRQQELQHERRLRDARRLEDERGALLHARLAQHTAHLREPSSSHHA